MSVTPSDEGTVLVEQHEHDSGDPYTLKSLQRLPDNWAQEMLNMYNEGCSDREIMREFKLTPHRWQRLCEDTVTSNFGEVVEVGRVLSHAWWERIGRTKLGDKSFNTGLWWYNMQNRFGWSQKATESRTNIEFGNMDDAELEAKIRSLKKELK